MRRKWQNIKSFSIIHNKIFLSQLGPRKDLLYQKNLRKFNQLLGLVLNQNKIPKAQLL